MATLNTTYANASRGNELIKITYNDTTNQVINGEPLGTKVSSGLSAGSTIFSYKTGNIRYTYYVTNSAPYAAISVTDETPVLPDDLSIDSIDVTPAVGSGNGSIVVHASGSGTKQYSIDGGVNKQLSNAFILPAGFYFVRLSRSQDSKFRTQGVTIPHVDAMVVNITKVDCKSNGGNDGSISIQILAGSGKYRIDYDDLAPFDLIGPEVNGSIRSPLAPGTYGGTVTDLTTLEQQTFSLTITEPPPVQVPPTEIYGSIFSFPVLNSLTFVIASDISCETPQALDNVLLADQRYKGIEKARYWQKFNRCDKPVIQLNSDFPSNIIQLRKCSDGTVVKTLDVTLKEQNVGKTQAFSCYLTNNPGSPGQSRVYFNTSALPVPVAVNDPFEISNNTDGFNGNYLVLSIGIDVLLGKQYLVISCNYTAGTASSNATATFSVATVNFNVYESTLTFLDVDDGYYYVTAKGVAVNTVDAISEPIYIKDEHYGTIKVECRHRRNGHGGVTWSTGYTAMFRVEGHFGNLRNPGGDIVINRQADNSASTVDSKPTRPLTVTFIMLPPYLFEKLGISFKSHFQAVNGIEVTATEGMSDLEFKPNTLFANGTIKVEQNNWFGPYNNTGIGTVVDGGYITTETGFLKR